MNGKGSEPGRDQWPSRHARELPGEGHMEREPSDPGPRALASAKQTRAGSAEGVGSVDYEDSGAFDVTRTTETTLRPEGREEMTAPPAEDDNQTASGV